MGLGSRVFLHGYRNSFYTNTSNASLSAFAVHCPRLQESVLSAGSFCAFPPSTNSEKTLAEDVFISLFFFFFFFFKVSTEMELLNLMEDFHETI